MCELVHTAYGAGEAVALSVLQGIQEISQRRWHHPIDGCMANNLRILIWQGASKAWTLQIDELSISSTVRSSAETPLLDRPGFGDERP